MLYTTERGDVPRYSSTALVFRRYTMLRSFFAKEEGQGLVEYALILVLIAVVVIGALTLLGSNINNLFTEVAGTINRRPSN
jgi:pilus assembly protein Flp/PilA